MATKITRWWPSHCSCCLQYTWDNETSEEDRVHTFMCFVSKCMQHQHLPETQDSFDQIIRENQEYSKLRAEEDAANG